MKTLLNIGCGELKSGEKDEYKEVTVDIREQLNPDYIWDLDYFPWPIEDKSIDKIICFDLIEHLEHVITAVEEMHRILKDNGIIEIHTTWWKTENSFTDPTHKHFFTLKSFDYFDPRTLYGQKYKWYSYAKFKIIDKSIDGQELYFKLQKVNANRPLDYKYPDNLYYREDELKKLAFDLIKHLYISKDNTIEVKK